MSSRRILITGGTGFLGGQLIEQLLAEDANIRVLCRNTEAQTSFPKDRIEWVQGDLSANRELEFALDGIDDVYHIAGLIDFSATDPSAMLGVNEAGVRRLFTAAKNVGIRRIVHVSSVSTIGGTTDPKKPLNEDDFEKGTGIDLPYPYSKRMGERAALEFANDGLPIVIVNPTFFGGPGDVNLSSARTVVSFARGQVWVGLTKGGMGYTDARDIATGMRLAMEKGRPGRRYILGGKNLLLREYHELLGKIVGRRPPRIRIPPWLAIPIAHLGVAWYCLLGRPPFVGPGDVRMARQYWFYDYSRARDELGLVCRSPEESLRDTVEWLQDRGVISRSTTVSKP